MDLRMRRAELLWNWMKEWRENIKEEEEEEEEEEWREKKSGERIRVESKGMERELELRVSVEYISAPAQTSDP